MAQKMYDVSERDGWDRLFLIAAFLVGASGTIALKLTTAPVLVVAAFPLLILLAYVGACFTTQSLRIEPETIGDNCYYLGFLFTLTSLAVTLYQIRDVTGAGTMADDDLIPLVISGFGVALSSTIAGVFLRIILMQIRPDIVARDREARIDLSHAARDFRTTLANISRDVKASAIEGNQRTAERNQKIEEATEKHLKEADALLKNQSEAFDATLKDFTKRLSSEMTDTIKTEVAQAVASIRGPIDKTSDSLDRLAEIQEESEVRIRKSVDLIATSSDDLSATMSKQKEVMVRVYDEMGEQAQIATRALGQQISILQDRAADDQKTSAREHAVAKDAFDTFMKRSAEAVEEISRAGKAALEGSIKHQEATARLISEALAAARPSERPVESPQHRIPPGQIARRAPDPSPVTPVEAGRPITSNSEETVERQPRGIFNWNRKPKQGSPE